MSKRFLWLIIGLVIGAGAVWVVLSDLESVPGIEEQLVEPWDQQPSQEAGASPQPASREDTPLEVSDAALADSDALGGEPSQPVVGEAMSGRTEEIPPGAVALFYRASFGAGTENLKVVITDATGAGNGGVADVSWESGSKGIVRYIPETGQTDVIKTITSTSYSKSSIYPITVGGRLYTIRDWGSEWTVDNKRFTIEELDPHTGATLSSTDVTAEWFTFLDERMYFQSEVAEDFWTGQRSGGKLKAKTLGALAEQDLAVEGVRLHGVGGRLASVGDQEIRWHSLANGEVQSTISVAALSDENLWPDFRHVFFGDEAMFWAWWEQSSSQISIVRLPVGGEPEVLVSFDLDGPETGLVMDEHDDMLLIGFTSSVPPRGIGITQMFLMDTNTGSFEELPVEQHIPSAQLDAGGGLQLLLMP